LSHLNGDFHVIYVRDSLIRCRSFTKVRESIRTLFIYQANLNDTESLTFVSRNEDKKCLASVFVFW